jgi:hypothetical protein
MFSKEQMMIIKRTMKLLREGYPLNEASKVAKEQLIQEGKIDG